MAKNDVAGDSAGEADVQLKKRARRRLVGAVALVLFAVITLPMVMDHEPRPAGPEIQVRIPSQEGGAVAERVNTKPIKTPAPVAVAPATPTQEKPEQSAVPETKVAPPLPALAPVVDKPKELPAAKPEVSPPAPVEQKASKAEAAKASAALDGKSDTADAKADQWVVQLGAYKDAGNVKLMMGKLKEMNVPAYLEKFDTPQGPRTRVRAGPFPNKDAATKAQVRIKTIGVNGPVAPK
jgi:DedD protein